MHIKTYTPYNIMAHSGGGIRGVITHYFLEHIHSEFGIKSEDLISCMDMHTGTSIGGINAIAFAYGLSSQQMKDMFENRGKEIFPPNDKWYSWFIEIKDKFNMIWSNTPFYSQKPLFDILRSMMHSDITINDLKKNVLITAVKRLETTSKGVIYNTPSIQYISNISLLNSMYNKNLGYMKCVDAALCTSAAPIYFSPYRFQFYDHHDEPKNEKWVDGGVFMNNAAITALEVAKLARPNARRFNVLYVGTGSHDLWYDLATKLHSMPEELRGSVPTHGIAQMVEVIGESIKLQEATVQHQLKMKKMMDEDFGAFNYYVFQPVFPHDTEAEMDNTTPEFFALMRKITAEKFEQDKPLIKDFLEDLGVSHSGA